MRDCEVFRRLVSAYLDDELVGEDRAAFEQHVAVCSTCKAALADEGALLALLRDALPLYEAPTRLRQAVTRLRRAAAVRRALRNVLAAGLVAAMLAGGAWLSRIVVDHRERRPVSKLATLAAGTHLRYMRGELPLEVSTDRPDEVARWFAGRVPFKVELPADPPAPGERKPYQIAGGRLVSYDNDAAAFVAYRMDERPISLLVTSAEQAQPTGGTVVASGKLRFHVESVAGLSVVTWTDNGLTYALTSTPDGDGSRSCLVCHGSPDESPKLQPLAKATSAD